MTEPVLSKVSAYADNELNQNDKRQFEEELNRNERLKAELHHILLIKKTLQLKLQSKPVPQNLKARIGFAMMKEYGCDFGLGHKISLQDRLSALVKSLRH